MRALGRHRLGRLPQGHIGRVVGLSLVLALMLLAGRSLAEPRGAAQVELRVSEEFSMTIGELGYLPFRLQSAQGYRISEQGPLRIDLKPQDASLSVKKSPLRLSDAINASRQEPAFRAQLEASATGRHALQLVAHFWLCRGRLCRPMTRELNLQIEVTAPAAPDAGVASDNAERTAPN